MYARYVARFPELLRARVTGDNDLPPANIPYAKEIFRAPNFWR